MSLIGSLEDLGLGDILQIIHLSQKSGVLSIRGDGGEGRIVFQNGMVRLACLKGGPEDLRALLVPGGFVSQAEFEVATQAARESGDPLATALAKHASLSFERIESLRRESAEYAVGKMFTWTSGEFSFDVGAEEEFLDSEIFLANGVNAQYMAMESVRLFDEAGRSAEQGPGEEEEEAEASVEESAIDALVTATTERVAPEPEREPELEGEVLPPVIIIHSSLDVLDWVRRSLAANFSSVHAFQRSQEGLGRIRQYLARAQAPILLISPEIKGNPLSGIADAGDYVRRLREQVPRMPIVWLISEDDPANTGDEIALPADFPVLVHPLESALRGADLPEQLSEQRQMLARRLNLSLREEATRLSLRSRAGGKSGGPSPKAQSETAQIHDLE